MESSAVSEAVAQAIVTEVDQSSQSEIALSDVTTVTDVLSTALDTLNTSDVLETDELAAVATEVSETNQVIEVLEVNLQSREVVVRESRRSFYPSHTVSSRPENMATTDTLYIMRLPFGLAKRTGG